MREIKFRARGHFGDRKEDYMVENWQDTDLMEYTGFDGGGHFVLMQYTGLKDKNGKEIYEGDIVKCPLYGQTTGNVAFHEGCFIFSWEAEGGLPNSCALVKVASSGEVIGNIYEDGGLLPESNMIDK